MDLMQLFGGVAAVMIALAVWTHYVIKPALKKYA